MVGGPLPQPAPGRARDACRQRPGARSRGVSSSRRRNLSSPESKLEPRRITLKVHAMAASRRIAAQADERAPQGDPGRFTLVQDRG